MFKRVEKRRKKQEEDEELGLDGEMKELMGLQDTDSDESDSSSEGGSSDDEAGSEVTAESGDEEMDEAQLEVGDEEDEQSEGDDAESDEESEGDDQPPLTITEALANPVYVVSLDPEVKACVVCPGKLLKNLTMAEVHKASQAHLRRYARFVNLAGAARPEDDIRDLLNASTANTGGKDTSKRAEKRRAKQAIVKAKREKQKIMKAKAKTRKEKKAAAPETKASEPDAAASRPKKKRKTDGENSREVEEKPLTKTPKAKPTSTSQLQPTAKKQTPSDKEVVSRPATPSKPAKSSKPSRPEKAEKHTPRTNDTPKKDVMSKKDVASGKKKGDKPKRKRNEDAASKQHT